MENSLEKALEAKRQYEELKNQAIRELLKERASIDEKLQELGYSEAPQVTRTKRTGRVAFCKICNVEGHDARSHRSQEPKRPFTPDELKNL